MYAKTVDTQIRSVSNYDGKTYMFQMLTKTYENA